MEVIIVELVVSFHNLKIIKITVEHQYPVMTAALLRLSLVTIVI